MAVRTAAAFTASAVLPASDLTKLPGGWIGYVEASATQSGIGATTDLTSLTVAVTVGTSRRIRITCVTVTSGSVADNGTALQLKEGATALGDAYVTNRVVGIGSTIRATRILTPTSGAHTYKASLALVSGTGTVSSDYSATAVPYLLVEDIGPAA